MPKAPREWLRHTLDVIEFLASPMGELEIVAHGNVAIDPDDFSYEEHNLPRPIGGEAGRNRFALTLAMYEERWVDDHHGKDAGSRMLGRVPVHRSVWLEIGEPWLRRIDLAWRLFEYDEGEEAAQARDRLQAGWNLVQLLMAAEAYRIWRLKQLFATRPQDRDLSARIGMLELVPPRPEDSTRDIILIDRMLTDLREQVESVMGRGPW